MRRSASLALGLCLLFSGAGPGFTEKPLRLFFEKNIQVEAKPGEEHTVLEGEWLYKILQNKGYSGARIEELMPAIQALNPHIPDVNRLKPGQIIHIPENTTMAAPPARQTSPIPPDSYETIPYVVRPGDTLIQVLQARGVPSSLIFGTYMNLFLELNPSIPDTDTLQAGQEIILPIVKLKKTETAQPLPASPEPAIASPQTGVQPGPSVGGPIQAPAATFPETPPSSFTAPAVQPATVPPAPAPAQQEQAANENASSTNSTKTDAVPERAPRTGLPFVQTVLEQMRFRFTPGDESMFPLPGSGWLHVKLLETPLLETPWGGKALLCPVPKNSEWIENAGKLGMRVCTVSPNWSLHEILEKLASSFPDRFRLWSATQELVLTRDGIGLTLLSPHIAITEHGGKKSIHMIWARQSPNEPFLPQGLPEVLESIQVKIIELDSFNELSRLPSRPRESIYVPVATHMELIRAINPKNPEEFFGQSLPGSLNALLQLLRDKDLLHQGMVQASWVGGLQNRIAVQVPAWTVSGSENQIALLDRRFADPYLVSVLSHEGYTCFVLPD